MRTLKLRSKIVDSLGVKLRNRRVSAASYNDGTIMLAWKSLHPDGITVEKVALSPEAAAATCRLLMEIMSFEVVAKARKLCEGGK